MGLANQILAQRQFNEIANKFSRSSINATSVHNCSSECLQMLKNEGFIITDGQFGMHIISLPTGNNNGMWFDHY